MSYARLDRVIAEAVAAGILPPGTSRQSMEHRPWPVVLLTGIGAWLAAFPLIAIMFMTLEGALSKGSAPYLIGVVLVGGAILILRRKNTPLFLEQLAIPALLTGGFMLGTGLHNDLPEQPASALLAMLALAVALAVPRQWLRTLLGAAACVLTILVISLHEDGSNSTRFWLGLHVALAMWLATRWREWRLVEALSNGWVLTVLAGLAVWSGMTFLMGASLHGGGNPDMVLQRPFDVLAKITSAAMTGTAGTWLLLRWPSLREWPNVASIAVLVGLAWLMPSLGAVLLILAICAIQQRWKTAVAAGLAAAWIIGAFYYHLSMPLATKALIMVVAGSLLGAGAWFAARGRSLLPEAGKAPPDTRTARLAIAAAALAVLAVANIGIVQKENLIATGKPVFIALAPVDPRSLMQGDYMRLAYQLPFGTFLNINHPRILGTVDQRGVFTMTAIADSRPQQPGEIVIRLSRARGGWTVASDAWYFNEGEAARWSRAAYGEFRVDANGKALLVNLRGPALEPL